MRHGRIGAELDRPLVLAFRRHPLEIEERKYQPQRGVGFRQTIVNRQRFEYRGSGLRHRLRGLRQAIVDGQQTVAIGESRESQGIVRVNGNGLPKERYGLSELFRRAAIPMKMPAQVELIGFGIQRGAPRRQRGAQQGIAQRAHDRAGNLVLHLEKVIERAIVGLRPQVIAGVGPDQLSRDAYRVAGFAYAAFEHVGDVQRPRNIGNRRLFALEVEAGGAGRHAQFGNSREQSDEFLRQTVREVLLVLVLAHVHERQHCDRLFRAGVLLKHG